MNFENNPYCYSVLLRWCTYMTWLNCKKQEVDTWPPSQVSCGLGHFSSRRPKRTWISFSFYVVAPVEHSLTTKLASINLPSSYCNLDLNINDRIMLLSDGPLKLYLSTGTYERLYAFSNNYTYDVKKRYAERAL